MENENLKDLDLGIGTEEEAGLKPAKVKIEGVNIEEVQTPKGASKKVVCACKHPTSQDLVKISSVKYEKGGKLKTQGLWVNKDSTGLIRKGSALAIFLANNGLKRPSELLGLELDTALDEQGYLTFKGY